MTTKENFYLNYSLPKRLKNKEGALVRLDPIKKEWKYFYPKFIILDTNLETEIFRRKMFLNLRIHFISIYAQTLKKDTINEPEGLFDRWVSTQIQIQNESMDPLIPTYPNVEEPRIFAELNAHGISAANAKNLCRNLCYKSQEYAKQVYEFALQNKNHFSVRYSIKKDNHQYILTDGTSEVKISDFRYQKLKNEYIGDVKVFDYYVLILLLRYDTLGGNGLQAAVPPNIMKRMAEYFLVKGECFASPLNHYFPLYCSAFPDTDKIFNSMGSFFNFYPNEGVYEANPPFMELIMQKMVEHMEEVIYNSPKVGFIVVIPKWSDDASPVWALLTNSPYLSGYIDIDKEKHKYLQGYQHVKFTMWKAYHTTSIFILKGNLCPIVDITNKLNKFKKEWENL